MKFSFVAICVFIIIPFFTIGQVKDSSLRPTIQNDNLLTLSKSKQVYGTLLDSCMFLNSKATPQSLFTELHKHSNNQKGFYIVALLFVFFGIVKFSFSKYFSTLFSVFFNTTLRQNQLTDQLEQAKLPSLIFNGLFVITGGFYLYSLIEFFSNAAITKKTININYFLISIAAVAVCYIVKYFTLIFIGWLTNSKPEAKSYIFIIFLLNKVLGIFFLAIIPLLLFGSKITASYAMLFSLIGVALIFLLRYFRSYALLQGRLKISGFHFTLYVIALELMPLAIIFKFAVLFLTTKA